MLRCGYEATYGAIANDDPDFRMAVRSAANFRGRRSCYFVAPLCCGVRSPHRGRLEMQERRVRPGALVRRRRSGTFLCGSQQRANDSIELQKLSPKNKEVCQ